MTGASSGTGAATALAEQGATVLLAARRLDRLHELQEELEADAAGVTTGGPVLDADRRDWEQVLRVVVADPGFVDTDRVATAPAVVQERARAVRVLHAGGRGRRRDPAAARRGQRDPGAADRRGALMGS